MKKLIGVVSAIFVSIIMSTTVSATDNISVTVNGSPITFDVPPQIINGRTMVPLRAIFESMGATVAWNNETKTITAIKDNKTVQMTVDNSTIYINGSARIMDVSPTVVDGRTLVPARFVAEAFEADVNWDAKTSTVVIGDSIESNLINPSENLVISKLKTIPVITGIQAATETNDPNGKLHKEGGYTSAVYFSTSYVNQSDVNGVDIVDKGTQCGGQIEVYENEEDANKRNTYLSAFDGGIIDSGYHEVFGTMVIRISDKCTATQQKEIAELIRKAFTLNNTTTITKVEQDNKSNTNGFQKLSNWITSNGKVNSDDTYEISYTIDDGEMDELLNVLDMKSVAATYTFCYNKADNRIYILYEEDDKNGISSAISILSENSDVIPCVIGYSDTMFSGVINSSQFNINTDKIEFTKYRLDYTDDLIDLYSEVYTDVIKSNILVVNYLLEKNGSNITLSDIGLML